jgi:hypothetical protein
MAVASEQRPSPHTPTLTFAHYEIKENAAMSITGDLRALAKAGIDVAKSKKRGLTDDEIKEAKTVFGNSITYSLIMIADATGYNNRPFTFYSGYKGLAYILFLGPTEFAQMSDWATFIHEMTHVWQGQNHLISASYMVNSMIAQAIAGYYGDSDKAYDYKLTDPPTPWGEYNVEQQAHIVEDWYAQDGKSTSSPRYTYIRDNILWPKWSWIKEVFTPHQFGDGSPP